MVQRSIKNIILFISLSTICFHANGAFTNSNLPILIINTEGNQEVPQKTKLKATLKIISNSSGTNSITDTTYNYNGFIGIETRGNSTETYPKKPYDFETRDSLGENNNVSLLDMPKENDWILRASYFDHTFIRNPLANHMSRLLGNWASRTRHVEVVLNDEYIGIYILMEEIKRDKNRLDIAKLRVTEISGDSLTGGYIWEISGQGSNFGESRSIKYPDFEDAATEQIAYIRSIDDNFRSIMNSANYANDISGYSSVIDVQSFIDELIVQEAMRNSDAYGWSSYFHKDKNGKIKAGPVWDFDQSSGNSSYPDDGLYSGWMASHTSTVNTPFFWPILLEDPKFQSLLRITWEKMRSNEFKTSNLMNYIDSIAGNLVTAQEREFSKWPVLGENIWRETNGYQSRNTYQKEVDYLKSFLEDRWDWMDREISSFKIITNNIDYAIAFNTKVFPNPASEYLAFSFELTKSSVIEIQLFSITGELVQQTYTARVGTGKNVARINLNFKQTGIFYYRIKINGVNAHTGKFAKF